MKNETKATKETKPRNASGKSLGTYKKKVEKTMTVTTMLNLRSKPEPGSIIIKVLPRGLQVQVTDIIGDWAEVYLVSGVKGFVMKQYLK